MVVLAGKISIAGLLTLLPASIIGWAASAAVLQVFYLIRLQDELIDTTPDDVHIQRGVIGMIFSALLP